MKISGTEVSQTSAQGRSIVDETIRSLNIFHPVPDDRAGSGGAELLRPDEAKRLV
jgi:hypothetical protein